MHLGNVLLTQQVRAAEYEQLSCVIISFSRRLSRIHVTTVMTIVDAGGSKVMGFRGSQLVQIKGEADYKGTMDDCNVVF